MNLHDFRREYQQGGLRRRDLLSNPITQFEKWFDELLQSQALDPTAMVLSTVDSHHRPHSRIVLLKEINAKGFTFFTNRSSNKGKDMAMNNQVSLHFPWHFIERQVMIEGIVERLTPEEDAAYFASRPRESQLAAWASSQSEPLQSREALIERFESVKVQYPDAIPLPDYWGGYRVIPERIEFWQGGENRLHDRFIYLLEESGLWSIQRLSP